VSRSGAGRGGGPGSKGGGSGNAATSSATRPRKSLAPSRSQSYTCRRARGGMEGGLVAAGRAAVVAPRAVMATRRTAPRAAARGGVPQWLQGRGGVPQWRSRRRCPGWQTRRPAPSAARASCARCASCSAARRMPPSRTGPMSPRGPRPAGRAPRGASLRGRDRTKGRGLAPVQGGARGSRRCTWEGPGAWASGPPGTRGGCAL